MPLPPLKVSITLFSERQRERFNYFERGNPFGRGSRYVSSANAANGQADGISVVAAGPPGRQTLAILAKSVDRFH